MLKDNNGSGFSQKIRDIRRRLDMTQRQFAAHCGLTQGLIGQWESDAKLPGREAIDKLVKATGVSRDWLLGSSTKAYGSLHTDDAGEIELVLAFRRLPPLGKKNALKLCQVLFDKAGVEKQERTPVQVD